MTEYTPFNPSRLQMKQLLANLNRDRVAQRSQGGAKLSYLEAWDVRATLNRIFGFANWSADLMEPVQIVRIDDVQTNQGKPAFRALAKATVRVTIHATGATYTESAVASQTGPDIGEVTDFAVKTAESDAFKRACVNLGTQFGMSLYNKGALADVTRVVLDPVQSRTIDELRNPEVAAKADAERLALESKSTVDPGFVAPIEPPAPGEDPVDDLPAAEQEAMALAGAGSQPSAASSANALDAVRQGFNRNGRTPAAQQ